MTFLLTGRSANTFCKETSHCSNPFPHRRSDYLKPAPKKAWLEAWKIVDKAIAASASSEILVKGDTQDMFPEAAGPGLTLGAGWGSPEPGEETRCDLSPIYLQGEEEAAEGSCTRV